MLLTEYPWSRNPRGMHNRAVFSRPDLNRYRGIRAGWIKLVSYEDDYTNQIGEYLASGMTPIVRIYRAGNCGLPADLRSYQDVERYIQAGARYFEYWNEPNLGHEWPPNLPFALDSNDRGNVIAPLMDHWLDWAERVIALGGFPGFIALSESSVYPQAAIPWLRNMMSYLREAHNDRFYYVVRNGLWLSSHPYIYNHFYQEVPGGGALTARQPQDQRASEGGWHFEYPYDPICQASDPGRTVWGGTTSTPLGDPLGLVAMGRAFLEILQSYYGGNAVVPVIGTEGGIWPFPDPGGVRQDDTRYPGFNRESHAEATAALFDWIATQAPPWFWGLALWKEDDYWEGPGGVMPAISKLEQTSAPQKSVPAIGLPGGGPRPPSPSNPGAAPLPEGVPFTPAPTPTPEIEIVLGPGPIRGSADLHFVILGPGLDPAWFFDTAQDYWARFRPAVMSTDGLIERLPAYRSLAVTVIAPPDQVAALGQQIRERWPNIWYDLVIADSRESIARVFNGRVAVGRRFG